MKSIRHVGSLRSNARGAAGCRIPDRIESLLGTLVCVVVLLGSLVPIAAGAQPAGDPNDPNDPTERHRWHTPRRGARDLLRDVVEPVPGDWNPLSGPAGDAKAWLKEHGVTTDLFVTFFNQTATQVVEGQHNYATFAWRSLGDWKLLEGTAWGDSYLEWNLNGTVGLDYDESDESLSGNAGIRSIVNGNVFPDEAVVDELFWKQVSPNGEVVVMAGIIDHSFHFDVNRVANDSNRSFFSFALVNNLSIPWPLYGGVGGLLRWNASERVSLLLGGGDSAADEAYAFWRTWNERSWWGLFEVDLELDLPLLGKGHYRVTPWYNHLDDEDGWGIGLNVDQELGLPGLVGFFRFGAGPERVTEVRRFASAGIGLEAPFGRSGDFVGIGFAWSDPSDGAGGQNETLVEAFYRFQLTPTLELTPDLQIVFDPAGNPDDDVVFVPGIRLALVF